MFDFPNSPTNGQQVTGPGGVVYTWDTVKWTTATGGGNVAFAPLNNPVFVGDPQAPTPAQGDADTSIATTAFVTPLTHNVGRNLLHNGLFNIQQRGAGPWTGGLSADRWTFAVSNDTSTATIQPAQDAGRAQIGDEAYKYYYQIVFTGTSTANAATQLFQSMEDLRRFSGKTLTLSFWAACASGTLKVGVNFWVVYGSGGSPSAGQAAQPTGQAVTITTTWARYSVTIPIPSAIGKTLGTSGDHCCQPYLGFSTGSTNNAFYGNIGVQSGTVYLWGVQCEIGSVATPLEKLDPQTDLANCQRFYCTAPYSGTGVDGWTGAAGQGISVPYTFPVSMRAYPSVQFVGAQSNNVTSATPYANNAVFKLYLNVTAAGSYYYNCGWAASADL